MSIVKSYLFFASEVISVTLKDETGMVNVSVWRDVAERQGEVIHLVAGKPEISCTARAERRLSGIAHHPGCAQPRGVVRRDQPLI